MRRIGLIVAGSLMAAAAFAQQGASDAPEPAAVGDEIPPFLEGTALYSTKPEACPASANASSDEAVAESLQISRSGVFGYEFGCTFTAFFAERDPESKQVLSWVGLAQCGDDSGITRPDAISIIAEPDGKTLTLQSQNEYVLQEALRQMQSGTSSTEPPDQSFVSAQYTRCPNT